jgi:hypothetical protein
VSSRGSHFTRSALLLQVSVMYGYCSVRTYREAMWWVTQQCGRNAVIVSGTTAAAAAAAKTTAI